jgi:methylmalonyl-CoA decarboxylase
MNAAQPAEPVTVSAEVIDGCIGKIVFRNPSRRHALSNALLDALCERLAELATEEVPVVVLGSGIGDDVWSAGHDLGELALDRDPLASGKPLEQALRLVRTYPGVVIAMVSGSAWGGAVDLVMSCDLVVADTSARFAMTPANIGLPYSTSGLLRFFNNLPIHVLKEMFFCARPLDALQAERFGVINRLVEPQALESTTLEVARGIAAKAPLAIRAVKEQLRVLEDMQPMPVETMERIAALRRIACESADMAEGLEAFVQRRPPKFKGQ